MKHFSAIFTLITLLGCFFCLDTIAQDTKTEKDNFTIQVDGLGCPYCAYGLEKKFKELDGLDDVKIEMETGIFTFTLPSASEMSLEGVKNQVAAAGYTPMTLEVERADGEVEKGEVEVSPVLDEANGAIAEFLVGGNCGMCKNRIETAAKEVAGVSSAYWNGGTGMLLVQFDEEQTSRKAIEMAVATSGHDTKNAKADKKTYRDLPGCCKYDRKQF